MLGIKVLGSLCLIGCCEGKVPTLHRKNIKNLPNSEKPMEIS